MHRINLRCLKILKTAKNYKRELRILKDTKTSLKSIKVQKELKIAKVQNNGKRTVRKVTSKDLPKWQLICVSHCEK